jgi:alkylhydroperoxidase/carboxymuconolactone decarboxylase family protein YurZ
MLETALEPKNNKLNEIFKNKNNLTVHTRHLAICYLI